MPPPTNPGTRVEYIRFPAFAVDWSASHAAYCGGGGSAKTGVSNSIVLVPNRGGGAAAPASASSAPISIDTGDQICVGVALHPLMGRDGCNGDGDNRFLLAAVASEVQLYDATSGSIAGRFACPDMVNCVAFDRTGRFAAAGCEDGTVVTFSLEWGEEAEDDDGGWQKVNPDGSTVPAESARRRRVASFNMLSECRGHAKAVSGVSFNPTTDVGDFFECLSCGKDGTARIWDAHTGEELATLKCTVDDPGAAPPVSAGAAKRSKAKNARVDQILVRSSIYGSDGRTVYTVASRRRGRSVVSRWRYLAAQTPRVAPPPTQPPPQQQQPPMQPGVGPPPTQPPQQPQQQPQQQQQQPPQPEVQGRYVEVDRAVVSPKPVSAFVMDAARTRLYLGDVDGTVTVMDGETLGVRRRFEEVHDLPVTGMAARPGGLGAGADGEDADVEVLSASADCRMVFLSTRREPLMTTATLIKIMVTILVVLAASYASYDRCGTHLELGRLVASWRSSSGEMGEFGDCVWHSLVAPGDVPGVSVIPY